MKKDLLLTLLFLFLLCHDLKANGDSLLKKIKFSGYAEVYYQYNLNTPANHQDASFIYDYARHNEFNPHLILAKMDYDDVFIRSHIGLGIGTYMDANYANEPISFKNLFEANVGIKLLKKKDLWLDLGLLPSHIGQESGIGKLNYNLTRSIMADNSPFFVTGAKLSYTTSKWCVAGFLLTGWQRIKRVDGNSTPAFGTQICFTPNATISFNSSSFVGSELPDSASTWRYFHNFYTTINFTKNFSAVACFDIGWQQHEKGSEHYYAWYGAALMLKYALNEHLSLAGRSELYADKENMMIATRLPTTIYGHSLNADYALHERMLLRLEAKWFYADEAIFLKGTENHHDDVLITTAAIISL